MTELIATPSSVLAALPPAPALALDGVAPLPDHGVIEVSGADAASFLHGQLTQDFALLGTDRARLAGYCSAKGRLLASFVGFRLDADRVLLVCSADLLAPTMRRLSMFVLRAKARLRDASADWSLRALLGSAAPAAGALPSPWLLHRRPDGALVVTLPPAGTGAQALPRALWLAPAGAAEPAGAALGAADALAAEVLSGVARITAPVVEQFVPQMLNHESVGGVNFRKGCYPGQEVVARSQFRGTLKRRATLVLCDQPLAAGQELFSDDGSADEPQPIGLVAQAAALPDGRHAAIASLQWASLDGQPLRAGAGAAVVTPLAPPYALLEDL